MWINNAIVILNCNSNQHLWPPSLKWLIASNLEYYLFIHICIANRADSYWWTRIEYVVLGAMEPFIRYSIYFIYYLYIWYSTKGWRLIVLTPSTNCVVLDGTMSAAAAVASEWYLWKGVCYFIYVYIFYTYFVYLYTFYYNIVTCIIHYTDYDRLVSINTLQWRNHLHWHQPRVTKSK